MLAAARLGVRTMPSRISGSWRRAWIPTSDLIRQGGMLELTGRKECADGWVHDRSGRLPQAARRVEGQVRGLQRMVESEAYCIDILTQVAATTRALQSVALELLSDHLGHCVVEAAG